LRTSISRGDDLKVKGTLKLRYDQSPRQEGSIVASITFVDVQMQTKSDFVACDKVNFFLSFTAL
jgi:hypothetical protein